ncbi:hypothetical protein [Paraburkholderia youngii]|uniref:hypothetical protein n=1 Tax=Paraburkholderia youngii TaxID=2782701 RepID=UPI003D25BD17
MKIAIDPLARVLVMVKSLFITCPCGMSVRELCQFRFDVADKVELVVLAICLLAALSGAYMYTVHSMTETQMYAISASDTGVLMVSLTAFTWYRADMCDPAHVARRLGTQE